MFVIFGGLYACLWSAAWIYENENSYENPIKDIFVYSFIPQIKLYKKYNGILNKTGKIIVVLAVSLFLIPTNIILLAGQIALIACYLFWSLFMFLFKERK